MKRSAPASVTAHLDPAGVAVEYGDFVRDDVKEWSRAPHLTLLSRLISDALWKPLRLIVSMPVRHGKSELCAHWAPIWYLLNRPDTGRVLVAGHNDDFARFFGRRIRDRLRENPRLGLQVRPDVSAAGSWQLTSGASLHTAGVGGSITGRGFDFIIIDDAVKDHEAANSEVQRDSLWDWFTGTLSTRLQPGGSIVIIQSRWHEDDLVGRLLSDEYESEEYHEVCLPAIATGPDVLGREAGDALWPDEWPLEELARRRRAVGNIIWAAQYQNSPSLPEGNLFRREWWQYCDAGDMPTPDMSIRVWDLAYSVDGDWTVGVLMHVHHASRRIYIADVNRFRKTPGLRDKEIRATAEKDGTGVLILLPDDLGQVEHFKEHVLNGFLVEGVQELKSKPERAVSYAARVEGQDVYLVRDTPDNPWNAAYVNELAEFPNGTYDDQVDPSANGYNLLNDPRFAPLLFT